MKNQLALTIVLATLAGASLQAETLIDDTFSGTNGSTIDGRTPDTTDVPQVNWEYIGWSFVQGGFNGGNANAVDTSTGNPSPSMGLSGYQGDALDIGSNSHYTKPNSLAISGDIEVSGGESGTTDGGNPPNALGVGIGYFSAVDTSGATSFPQSDFTGFALSNDGVDLSLIVNGAVIKSIAADAGTENFYSLSYTVTNGALTNLTFNGTDDTSDFSTTAFTNAATAYAGVFAQNYSGYDEEVDNFVLAGTTTPEPTTFALLAGGGLALLVVARVRRGNS